MAFRRFEDLDVWQAARELYKGVHRACESQPLHRDYARVNQMKCAAISVSSNIAEGFERGSRKQNIEACFNAKGSAGELRCQVILAHDNGLLDEPAYDWLVRSCEKRSRMLSAYIAHLQETKGRFPGVKLAARNATRNVTIE